MTFFKDVIAHLLKTAFEGHTKFSVADNTAVGDNPVRSISLDAVPTNESTIISLSWDGGEKLFEKTLSEEEASHQFDLISTDLAEVAALTKQGQYDAAKDLMKKLGQKYAENTGDIIDTNLPKLHNTQASQNENRERVCVKCLKLFKSKEDALSHAKDNDGHHIAYNDRDKEASQSKKADAEIAFERAVDRLDNKLMRGLIHQEDYDAEYAKLKKEMFPKEASEDDHLLRTAKITMQNLWFSTTDELLEYQEKQKGAKSNQDHIPLWDAQKGKAPEAKDELAPASMSYEDLENSKEKDHEDMQKHIDEKIKTELESALQQKAASVFGPDQVELVEVLRKNGRNWDEIKKILVKDFGFDKDSTNIFVDEQRQGADPTGIEVEPVKEEEKPLTPPEDLVSPETHEKLLQDHEDKKKVDLPVKEDKELNFTPKDVMDIPEDNEIEEASSMNNEIARADNDDIHKVAADTHEHTCPKCDDVWKCHKGQACNEAEKALCGKHYSEKEFGKKKAAPSDLNPLQEPITEQPTTSVPSQDVVPMGQKSMDHDAPQHGDRVFVTTDLSSEKSGFEANFINPFKGNHGEDLALVETDQGDQLEVALNRVVKINEGSGAQETEPVMEPEIATQKEQDISVTPKMDDLHTSSQDPFLALKVEAEALLKTAEVWNLESEDEEFASEDLNRIAQQAIEGDEGAQTYLRHIWNNEPWEKIAKKLQTEGSVWYVWWMDGVRHHMALNNGFKEASKQAHKISYLFVKKGFEKHANDSAFEANGWTRVWVDESEIEVEPEYAEILKMPDEAARIQALKQLARKIAQDTLSTKSNAGGDIAQMWFDSLKPSDHDRIDWVKLANPQPVESSLEPKVEKIAADGSACIKCNKVLPLDKMVKNEHGAGYLCSADAPEWNKEASDFEKGISQNKTSADPVEAPKTQFKDYKITPKYAPKEQAMPASPEMGELLSKMESLQSNLDTLAMARKQMQAKVNEELTKLDTEGQRPEMEAALQETIQQTSILFDALENKVVQWKDKLYTLQTEQIDEVPNITDKEKLKRLYAKFEGAEKYIKDVLNGMLSQAKRVVEKTLIRWPNKKSSVDKEANIIDEIKKMNEELLAALQLLSSPL